MTPSIVPAAVLSVLTGLCVWAFQDARHGAQVAEMRLQWQDEREANTQRLRIVEGELNAKYQTALNLARDRERHLRNELASLGAASNSLRTQAAEAARRLAQAPAPAVLEYANAVSSVFDECQARYGEVAAKADGHSSDARTLIEAWPVINGSTPD